MAAAPGPTLLLGCRGMLGRELGRLVPGALAVDRDEVDVTDPAALDSVLVPGVTLVLNAAADTRVDLCESDRSHLAVNAVAPGEIAERCARIGARLVHVSTDHVFDGRGVRPYHEDDPVDPVNAYGRGKLDGERAVLGSGADAVVVRTSWLFGRHGPNFVDALLKQVEEGHGELRVVADQSGRATAASDLARAILLLAAAPLRGVVHFANCGETTWYGLALAALELSGHRGVLVHPCPTNESPRPARRPSYSVLDTSLYERVTGVKPRPFTEALADYLAERGAPVAA